MRSEELLRVKNLRIEFQTESGFISAVHGIDFELKKGETLGIVGESGSGKSVTSLALMRLLPADLSRIHGRIHFEGAPAENLLDLEPGEMRQIRGARIAMIFQEPMTSLNPVQTCGFQVAEALREHLKMSASEARQRVLELFEEVELPNPARIYSAYPFELSGGQKQRVMIAMAISCEPQLLIADEPTTALDVTVQRKILELLAKLQRKTGMAMIFISHDLAVVAEIADRALVMYRGNVVENGAVAAIFTNPGHPYTKGLLACRPVPGKRPLRLPVVSDFINRTAEGGFVKLPEPFVALELPEERSSRLKRLYEASPLLQVKHLSTWFPVKKGLFRRSSDVIKAVNDVNFEVFKGETLGLVGESGCGKTTLSRTLLRLAEPTSGNIFFGGKNLVELSEQEMRAQRKRLQIIFQDPYSSLNPRLTIGQALAEPLEVHQLVKSRRARKQRVLEMLEKVGLREEYYARYPHEFSGGQRQRIGIARALILEPEFVICDESVSALDVSVQAQVLNLLNDLKAEYGLTYIFISHDLSVVKYMADRMLVMNKGVVEEIGDADEVYANPKSDYTKKLIAAIPTGEGVLDKKV